VGIRIVQKLSEHEWRLFVDRHPDGNIFHTPEMFQVFSLTKRHRPELWAATENGSIRALLLPVRIALKNGLPPQLFTRSIAYGSILCVPGAEGLKALGQLLQTYTQEADGTTLFTELRNLKEMGAIQPLLEKYGFVYSDDLNYLINLQPPSEEVLKRIGPRTRKHIRRGLRREEIIISEVKNIEQLSACYTLVQKSYRRARVPLADFSLFEAAFDLLYPKKMVKFTLAGTDEAPIAASAELFYKDLIYGWFGGMDRLHTTYAPNELLMWHILKCGSENGFRLYDFGGAGKPEVEYGVRNFKAKFGGQQVCYGRNTYVHSPRLLRVSEKGYNFLRKLLYG
jgi:lipid II:glycine glycyltransferase (peptidoglycan interpeptide bridge formation enzyme)